MDARRTFVTLFAIVLGFLPASDLLGASDRSKNFIVSAPTRELAREVSQFAEQYRRDLAIEWIGQELPRWAEPCPITVRVGRQLGAGGATSFMFDRGRPFGWRMSIQGSRERILDSVLPHEVTHTIFATYFGRPLPRWADEGACTSVEHPSEKSKQEQMLNQFLRTKPSRGIPFNRMFAMREYPSDIMPLYSQGFSLVRFLLHQGGKQKFVRYVADGMQYEDWDRVTNQHYGFRDLSELQLAWVDWVAAGSPVEPSRSQIASNAPRLPSANVQLAQASRNPRAATPRVSQPRSPLVPVNQRQSQPVTTLANQTPPTFIARGQDSSNEESWYAKQRDKIRGKSLFPLGGSAGETRIAFSSFASIAAMTRTLSKQTKEQVDLGHAINGLDWPVPPPPALKREANELLQRPLVPMNAKPAKTEPTKPSASKAVTTKASAVVRSPDKNAAKRPVRFWQNDKPLSQGGTVWR